eukprot:scaffold34.g4504.t1
MSGPVFVAWMDWLAWVGMFYCSLLLLPWRWPRWFARLREAWVTMMKLGAGLMPCVRRGVRLMEPPGHALSSLFDALVGLRILGVFQCGCVQQPMALWLALQLWLVVMTRSPADCLQPLLAHPSSQRSIAAWHQGMARLTSALYPQASRRDLPCRTPRWLPTRSGAPAACGTRRPRGRGARGGAALCAAAASRIRPPRSIPQPRPPSPEPAQLAAVDPTALPPLAQCRAAATFWTALLAFLAPALLFSQPYMRIVCRRSAKRGAYVLQQRRLRLAPAASLAGLSQRLERLLCRLHPPPQLAGFSLPALLLWLLQWHLLLSLLWMGTLLMHAEP